MTSKSILFREELDALARKAKADASLFPALLRKSRPVIGREVRDWRRHADVDDLEQEGRIAVWAALETWDLAGAPFGVHLERHVFGRVARWAAQSASVVKLTHNDQVAFVGGTAAQREALARRLPDWTLSESRWKAEAWTPAGAGPGKQTSSADLVLDPRPNVEERFEAMEARQESVTVVWRGVRALPHREKRVILARYLTTEPMKLRALGRRLQLDKEQVRQAEIKALGALAEMVGSSKKPERIAQHLPLLFRRSERQRDFVFMAALRKVDCRFCPRPRLPNRSVCDFHQWQRDTRCAKCRGLLPYSESCGRKRTYCDACKPTAAEVALARYYRLKKARLK